MIIPIELDNSHPIPTHPNACLPHQRELRAGWVVTPGTSALEDDLPQAIYVSDLASQTVTRLDILSFEFIRGPQPPSALSQPQPQGFWQVTYRACID